MLKKLTIIFLIVFSHSMLPGDRPLPDTGNPDASQISPALATLAIPKRVLKTLEELRKGAERGDDSAINELGTLAWEQNNFEAQRALTHIAFGNSVGSSKVNEQINRFAFTNQAAKTAQYNLQHQRGAIFVEIRDAKLVALKKLADEGDQAAKSQIVDYELGNEQLRAYSGGRWDVRPPYDKEPSIFSYIAQHEIAVEMGKTETEVQSSVTSLQQVASAYPEDVIDSLIKLAKNGNTPAQNALISLAKTKNIKAISALEDISQMADPIKILPKDNTSNLRPTKPQGKVFKKSDITLATICTLGATLGAMFSIYKCLPQTSAINKKRVTPWIGIFGTLGTAVAAWSVWRNTPNKLRQRAHKYREKASQVGELSEKVNLLEQSLNFHHRAAYGEYMTQLLRKKKEKHA